MPQSFDGSITLLDKEVKTTVTALNFAETDVTAWLADPTIGNIHDWLVAVAGVSLLVNAGTRAGSTDAAIAPTPPTDDQAYRSSKLTVFYHDIVTGTKYRFSIGGRNAAAYNTYPRSKNVILTIVAGGTAAIEALVAATNGGKSPVGNSVAVDTIVVAGGRQG